MKNLALHCVALISGGLQSSTANALVNGNWKTAMNREFKSLKENGVWELVKPPSGQVIISGKWQFAHELDDDGNVVKHRSRFVSWGSIRRRPFILTRPAHLSWHLGCSWVYVSISWTLTQQT